MEDQVPAKTSDEISDGQWIVYYFLETISSSLSVAGGIAIIFKIFRDRARNGTTPYDRIMLVLSACNILSSITIAINHYLLPSGTGVWAIGNSATCQARGFLIQFSSFSAIWYNGLLSYYFLFTVLSQARRKDYVRTLEPWMHLTGVFFPVAAVTGLFLGWYDSDLCWIEDETIKYIVAGIPLLFVYLSMIVNYSAIYAIVRKAVRKTVRSPEHFAGSASVQRRIKKEATILMFSYVAAFFGCITPTVVKEILEAYFGYTSTDSRIYPLYILVAIFCPLQGFFNFLIYIKPAYTRFRANNPSKSVRFVLHQALFNPNVPQLYYSNDRPDPHPIEEASAGLSSIIFELHWNNKERAEESDSDSDSNEDSMKDDSTYLSTIVM